MKGYAVTLSADQIRVIVGQLRGEALDVDDAATAEETADYLDGLVGHG